METFGKNFDFLGRADARLPVLKNFAYQWNGVTDAKIPLGKSTTCFGLFSYPFSLY